MSTSPRAIFGRSVALGLGLVLAIILLGKALTGLIDLPAPVDHILRADDSDNVVRLSEAPVRPSFDSRVKIGQPRAATGAKSVALVPVTHSHSRSSAVARRKEPSRRSSSRVRRIGRGVGNPGTTTLPTGNGTAPATGQTPGAASPPPSSESGPVARSARKMKLAVANVSSAGGSTASAGGARLRITLADAQTGGAPETHSAGVTPTVDLQLGLTASNLAALAGAGAPQGPVVLRARLDVVDESGAGNAPEMRVRMQLADAPTETDAPAVVESGDDGGLSNAVDVLIPVDSSRMFRHCRRQPVETSAAPPAAEVRLPLATATADQPTPATPAPVSDGAELSLPDSGALTDGASAVQVAVQLETVTPPAPPSDPSEPAPTPPPEPTPTPTPTPTPEPTPAPAEATPQAATPAPATPQAAEATPVPAVPQAAEATPASAAPQAAVTPPAPVPEATPTATPAQ